MAVASVSSETRVSLLLAIILSLTLQSTSSQDNTTCGLQTANLVPETRIIGGKNAQEGEWPWQAAMLLGGVQFSCGGSLIDPEWILTAAHCVGTATERPELFEFRMGVGNLKNESVHMQQRRAMALYIHPLYKVSDGFNYKPPFDIALFKLESAFDITDYVRTVCLPEEGTNITSGATVTITGWGLTDPLGTPAEDLQELETVVVDQNACKLNWETMFDIRDEMLCVALTSGDGSCYGDSGGPLVMKTDEQWVLHGVTNFGFPYCSSSTAPNVYARVSSYLDWIQPVFEQEEPDSQPVKQFCTSNDYRCSLGACLDRSVKCNRQAECTSGSDEEFCDGLMILFDAFYTVRLNDTSIRESVPVNSAEECARICLDNEKFRCYVFDVIIMDGEMICAMAEEGYAVTSHNSPFYDRSVVHFQLDPTVDSNPNLNMTQRTGFISTPLKFSDEYEGPEMVRLALSIHPPGGVNQITFTFAGVETDEEEGVGDSCQNFVELNGTQTDSVMATQERICLYALKENNVVEIKGWSFKLAYNTANITRNKFVAIFKAEWKCDETIMVEDDDVGYITSPLYPAPYPLYLNCHTLLMAPEGAQVVLELVYFDIVLCSSGDNIAIYDGPSESSELLISCYSGVSEPPQQLTSSKGALLIVFTSDGSSIFPDKPGFNLAYYSRKEFDRGNTTCGLQTANLEPETRIIGGKNAQEGEWPWQAAMLFDGRFVCGASLIDPEWILTAAHCVGTATAHPELYEFIMGANNYREDSENMQRRKAVAMYVHPGYSISGINNYDFHYDVTLFKLESAFDITDYVRTVCMPMQNMTDFPEDMVGTITGWGFMSFTGSVSEHLQEVELFLVNHTMCASQWLEYGGLISPSTDNLICVGRPGDNDGKSACFGDSGGPLVIELDKQWVQLGVANFVGNGCSTEHVPNVYARVDAYLDWIQPVFDQKEPQGQPVYEFCPSKGYRCELGACLDRWVKCNGQTDCTSGSDEMYCEGLMLFFDAFYTVRLNDTSIRESVPVNSSEECARICLDNEKFRCYVFDVITMDGEMICAMAEEGYAVMPNEAVGIGQRNMADYRVVHFQLDPTVVDNAFDGSRHAGFISTPLKFSDDYDGPEMGIFSLFISPTGGVNQITFTFAGVETDEEEGEGDSCQNFVDFNGTQTDSVMATQERICLYALKENNVVEIKGWSFKLEFHAANVTTNGFVAVYKAEWKCDETIMVDDDDVGYITSPLYPAPYPSYLNCHTLLMAPEGAQVVLELVYFDIVLCSSGDNIAIYDGPSDSSELLISCYSGVSEPPQQLTSSKGALLIVFMSDGNNASSSLNPGFNLTYHTIPGPDADACGLQPALLDPESRIIGGQPAQEGEWPWQAAMFYDGQWTCGGSLIHPQWILTAAHCLRTAIKYPEMYQFRMGSNNIKTDSENTQWRRAAEIYMHPDFKIASAADFDIALFRLEVPFNITNFVRTVCLPEDSMLQLPVQSAVTVTGWGRTKPFGEASDYLLGVELYVVNQTVCAAQWKEYASYAIITDNMLCLGRPDKSTYQGDSGGPVVVKNAQQWIVVGVVSFGTGDCNSTALPAVQTRVSSFREWMQPIFEGGEPERQDSDCSDNEYLCQLGGCINRNLKCNGMKDCTSGSDEEYCESLELVFDAFYDIRLDDSSIRKTVTVQSTDECTQICLDQQEFSCRAFDFITTGSAMECAMAEMGFSVVPNVRTRSARSLAIAESVVHFEVVPVGSPPDTEEYRGVILSPGKFSSDYSGPLSGVFPVWIKPYGKVNTLTINIADVTTTEDASVTDCKNFVIGNGTVSEGVPGTEARYCLHELLTNSRAIEINGSSFRLEFHSDDVMQNQFVTTYQAEWKCHEKIMVDPDSAGFITSPMYPAAYPIFLQCHILLMAPEGAQVALELVYFDVSMCGNGDTLDIYDGTEIDESKMLINCTTISRALPSMLISTKGGLLIDFITDGMTVPSPKPGFNFTYVLHPEPVTSTATMKTDSPMKPTTVMQCNPDREAELEHQANTFKYALIGVSIGAGLLVIFLFFAVLYLLEYKSDLKKQVEELEDKNSKDARFKQNEYEMLEDPGFKGISNDAFDSI